MTAKAEETNNMRLISHDDLGGFGNIGEGIDLHQASDSRRTLYLAHESAPKNFTSVDVTDIKNPKMLAQTDLKYPHLRSNSLSIWGDTMLVAYQSQAPGQPGVGMEAFDISNPDKPESISYLDLSGDYSRGCHCLWWVDGEYAHLSTGAADFQPRDQKDDQLYMIVDVGDPSRPAEAGRWWVPGTREGDEAPPLPRHPDFDTGHSVHNANVYPQRPDRAYCGWKDSGVIILDISDKARPSMISQVNFAPPFPGFTHTVLPLFGRDLLVVTQEATHNGGGDYPKLVWIMDNRLETNPVIISTLPMQDTDDFFNRPGRYGAHNIHENQPVATSYKSDELVFATFFNGGIRVFDLANPFQPQEVASFIPPIPDSAPANGINDIFVDENRILYVVDRIKGGLYILELTI